MILTGQFRPYTVLIDPTPIEQGPVTLAPVVGADRMTSVAGIFAAGNVTGSASMHDRCALDGRRAARSILQALGG